MKKRHAILRNKVLAGMGVMVLGAGLGGCFHHAARSPSLTARPVEAGTPQQGILGKAADSTWNVVSAPVRWVIPGKKKATTQPVRYEPGELIIMGPNGSAWQADAAGENATQPETQPK